MDSKILPDLKDKVSLLKLIGFKEKNLTLLWRGTRDGFKATTFHRLCDGRANTLTLIKSTEGSVFGGYTSVQWDQGGYYQHDKKAFLFSFKNPSNVPMKMKVTDPRHAVIHSVSYGHIFGAGHDLLVSDSSDKNTDSFMHFKSYEFPDGKNGTEGGKFLLGNSSHKFQAEEVEVFQLGELKSCLFNILFLIYFKFFEFILNYKRK